MTHMTYLDAAVAALRCMRGMQAVEEELRRKHAGIPIVHAHHVARRDAVNTCIDVLKAEMENVKPHAIIVVTAPVPGSTGDTSGVRL